MPLNDSNDESALQKKKFIDTRSLLVTPMSDQDNIQWGVESVDYCYKHN